MAIFRRIANLFLRTRIDCEIDAELQSHISMRIDDNLAAGMSPAEARRDALLRFGNPITTKEHVVSADAVIAISGIGRDLRYALRQLRRSAGFALTAVITLALGTAATIIVFGVLNTVILRPLEVSDPNGLYQIRHKPWMSGRLLTTSYPAFEDLRQRNTTFSGMAGIYGYSHAGLSWRNAVAPAHGDEVTGNYFDLLGVQPELGRFFHAADEHGPGSAPYIVLSDSLWRSAFHADASMVGATVELNQHPFTVVGVAAAQFHGTERFVWPDYWMPMVNQAQVEGWESLHDRASSVVTVIGRLKPGVTPAQATENLNAIVADLAKEYPETDDGQPLRLIHPGLLGDDGEVIRGFLFGVNLLALLVLAAACANLATLFAARAADRSRELALRLALGSSRRRLAQQLLTEALVLSLAGGAAGLVIARLLLGVLNRSEPFVGDHVAVSLDARLCLAGLALTLGSALLFGMVAARHAWRSSPLQSMRGGRVASISLGRFALRDLMLGVQIAICTLLVTASLVAVRGLVSALHAPIGFRPQGAMLVDMDLSKVEPAREGSPEKEKALIEAARGIPGVTAVGTVNRTPFTGGMHGIPIFRPGTREFKLNNAVLAPYVFTISPGYLDAAGTRLLSGRDVSWHDNPKTPYVAIVNRTFARAMWGETAAIGQQFILGSNLTEVVGVAEDGKYHDLQESAQPVAYLPFSQSEQDEAVFVVRSWRAPNEMAAALRSTLSGIAPNVPVTVQSWTDSLESELFPAKAATVALGVMGLLAAMLAVTGIFGMAAYSVSKRMKELGIRVALGATREDVLGVAVGRPLTLLVAGLGIGLISDMAASRLLASIVYHAAPGDPLVLAGAVMTMALIGLAATWIPARRALRVHPAQLLREE